MTATIEELADRDRQRAADIERLKRLLVMAHAVAVMEPAAVTQDEFLSRFPESDRPQILTALARLQARQDAYRQQCRDAAARHRADELATDCQTDHDTAKWEGERR